MKLIIQSIAFATHGSFRIMHTRMILQNADRKTSGRADSICNPRPAGSLGLTLPSYMNNCRECSNNLLAAPSPEISQTLSNLRSVSFDLLQMHLQCILTLVDALHFSPLPGSLCNNKRQACNLHFGDVYTYSTFHCCQYLKTVSTKYMKTTPAPETAMEFLETCC